MELRRAVKDSVFSNLFSGREAQLEAYRALHPEATEVSADDIREVTLKNIVTMGGRYNDLGFMVGDRLLILMEAQSVWTENIVARSLFYLADTLLEGLDGNGRRRLYTQTKVTLPETELYVIYTGTKDVGRKRISLRESFYEGRRSAVDCTVEVVTASGGDDIIQQYISFCRILDEEERRRPDEKLKALEDAMRICMDRNILRGYLEERRCELMSIMELLYDQEAYTELDRQAVREESLAEGKAIGEAIGEAKGKAKGKAEGEILGTVKTLLALGKTEAEAVGFIVRKYGITEENARRVVDEALRTPGESR